MSRFGDPDAVAAAADDLRRASTVIRDARDRLDDARPKLWQGEAGDAYRTAATRTLESARALDDTLRAGSGTLARYAAVQRDLLGELTASQSRVDAASRSLRDNPLDLPAAFDLVQAELSALRAAGRLQEAAATAAAELRAAIGVEGDARPWWDPFGWFNDPEEPDERVPDDILDDDAFDPDDVSQGGIGDCFMLSSIVSLLNTDGGDEFIRDNVRWDAERGGYWVTLYPNGEPEEVFVEYVFDNGARQDDWQWLIFGGDKPSIAALYEAAIQQEYGYGYLDGGQPADAMELITGRDVVTVENDNNAGLSDRQLEGAREVLEDGGQVVISSPRSGEHRITVTAPDGSTRDIDIVNTHSYAVTRIEPDGSVWMRNPWGPGNSADGGGEFRVDAEDVADLFWRTSYTNVTG